MWRERIKGAKDIIDGGLKYTVENSVNEACVQDDSLKVKYLNHQKTVKLLSDHSIDEPIVT